MMIDFQDNGLIRIALTAMVGMGVAAVLQPSAARAQDNGAPGILLPLTEEPAQPPATVVPPPESRSHGNQFRDAAPKGVTVEPLAPPPGTRMDRVGLPTESFGPDVWAGADWQVVERLFRALPSRGGSEMANLLLRRLLATGVSLTQPMVAARKALKAAEDMANQTMPAAEMDAARGDASVRVEDKLLRYRVSQLLRRGHYDLAAAVVKEMPDNADPEIAQLEAEALMLGQDMDRACALVGQWVSRAEGQFWPTMLAMCQMRGGTSQLADTTRELLRDQPAPDSRMRDMLEGWAAGRPATLQSVEGMDPLAMTLMRESGAVYDGRPAFDADPWHLRALAENPNIRPEVRLRAAEEAVYLGAMPTSLLRHFYRRESGNKRLKKEELLAGIDNGDPGPRGRALLIGLVADEPPAATAADMIRRYLEATRIHGRPVMGMRVAYPYVRMLTPDRSLIWFSPHAVRTLLLRNDRPSARAWLALLRDAATTDSSLAEILGRLGPLIWISGLEEPDRDLNRILINWHAMESRRDPAGAAGRTVLALTLLDALGVEIPVSLWQKMIDQIPPDNGRNAVATPYLLALDEAAKAQRVGETILLLMLTLGEGDLGQVDPLALSHSVKALNRLGLVMEARALAVEAAVVGGL